MNICGVASKTDTQIPANCFDIIRLNPVPPVLQGSDRGPCGQGFACRKRQHFPGICISTLCCFVKKIHPLNSTRHPHFVTIPKVVNIQKEEIWTGQPAPPAVIKSASWETSTHARSPVVGPSGAYFGVFSQPEGPYKLLFLLAKRFFKARRPGVPSCPPLPESNPVSIDHEFPHKNPFFKPLAVSLRL